MTDPKHPHHGHKPHDCDKPEPDVSASDFNEPLPVGEDDPHTPPPPPPPSGK